jgi:hypothetical protein
VITTASLVRASLGLLIRVTVRFSKRLLTPSARMPSVSDSSAVYGVSASIICSSSMKSNTSRVLNASRYSFNRARPHQGSKRAASGAESWVSVQHRERGKILSFPALGGLHRDSRRSACVFSERKVRVPEIWAEYLKNRSYRWVETQQEGFSWFSVKRREVGVMVSEFLSGMTSTFPQASRTGLIGRQYIR